MSLRRGPYLPDRGTSASPGGAWTELMATITDRSRKAIPSQMAIEGLSVEIDRMENWVSGRIKAAQRDIVLETTTLTPVLAEVLLRRNPANRSVSADVVEKYTRDIIEDRWSLNGEPIIVSRDGLLNDGQHRCRAVIAAGLSIRVVIVFGVSRESRFTIDQGRIRTAGDYLSMNGHVEANHVATVATYIWQYRSDRSMLSTQSAFKPTKAEVLLVADHYPDIIESVKFSHRPGAQSVGGRSVLAFCHWCFAKKTSRAIADEFFESLISGGDLPTNSPILYARNRLMAGHRFKPNEKAQLIFRAWNAHRKRQTPKTLVIADTALPAVEG